MSRDDTKRAIGKVVSVSADHLVIEMHAGTDNFTVVGFDDVHYVARLGSFLMIPVQSEYVVAEVIGLRERDSSNNKTQKEEFDKAASAKYLDVVPVGMLPQGEGKFRFGVSVFPSLYADALYALDSELDRIFDTDNSIEKSSSLPTMPGLEPTRVKALTIGKSVVFEGYNVKVQLDDFFGGHVAILGNTGSGKSCTTASILQSLFGKTDEHIARGATFILFDVNGEYSQALKPLASAGGIGVTEVVLDGTSTEGKFQLPHWFLKQGEWELLLQASEKTQLPVLRTALGLTSLFRNNTPETLEAKEHFISTCVIECFRGADGDSPVSKFQRVLSLLQKYPTATLNAGLLTQYGANFQYGNFVPQNNLTAFLEVFQGKLRQDVSLPAYTGDPFSFEDLEEALDFAILYEEAHGNRQIRDYCSQMVTRFKSLKERADYEFLRCEPNAGNVSEADFLNKILGVEVTQGGLKKKNQLVILNMNAVEDEVVELVASVIARMTFRALRRAEPRNRFPVHLLLEEAHRYVAERNSGFSIDATSVYERIAKEGRKYGLFLMVASQRPSELSKTVLSQCSNFVIHRIQNPDDLSQIRQMTPFISDNVLKRLPSLPKQHALIFGTAVNLPTTFKVLDANPIPLSDDAKIRELWFHGTGKFVQTKLGQA